MKVAQGGFHGIGNARYKSSTNRAPRQSSPGTPGETRALRLELKLLADVGLLGLPNAGKSTFLAAASAARPKIADYPFTTLHPQLGIVDFPDRSGYSIVDIPGLIEGAADGAGLGMQFLKHLGRTRVLLHLVDASGMPGVPPLDEQVAVIEQELAAYGGGLLVDRPRWLVLNKTDLIPEDEREAHCRDIIDRLGWGGPVFQLSALTKDNTEALCWAILEYLEACKAEEAADPDLLQREIDTQKAMQSEARERIQALAEARRTARKAAAEDDDDNDDDDGDVEVVYQP